MRPLLLFVILLGLLSTAAAKPAPTVYLPKQGGHQLKVAVWLHGYRGYPGVIAEPFFQDVADRLNIAIVGLPGTTELGDETQQWSEEPVADNAYIQDFLGRLARKHDLDVHRVALFGFSQGAMVAADLCTRFPALYSGAIVMSPGGVTNPQPSMLPNSAHREQVFWLTCLTDEHPGNVELTRGYARHLKELGARVTKLEYPGKAHARPPDFRERVPEWIAAILKLEPEKPQAP